MTKEANGVRTGGKSRAGGTKGPKKVKRGTAPPQHVIEENGFWVVKGAGLGPMQSKALAIDEGRRIARSLGTDLLVHGKSGQIFQHSPIASELPEDAIREAIRSANQKVTKKAAGSRKKLPARKK